MTATLKTSNENKIAMKSRLPLLDNFKGKRVRL